jgi:hypothetical protein
MDRFTWGVAGGTILLVVAGIVAVLILQRQGAPPDLATPEGTVRAYIEALDRDRPEDAWALLSTRLQAQNQRDEFIRRAAEQHYGRGSRITIEPASIEGNTARVELVRTYRNNGGLFDLFEPSSYSNRESVRLVLENGQWRLTVPPQSYLLNREPITPTPIPPTPVPPTSTPTSTSRAAASGAIALSAYPITEAV